VARVQAIHYAFEGQQRRSRANLSEMAGRLLRAVLVVNPWWTLDFKEIPKHEVTRGVKPFAINDEWYYHMRLSTR